MDSVLSRTCETFIENRDILKETFGRDGMAMHLMGAAVMSSMDGRPEAETLKECEKLLKKIEGFFSPFRGALKLPVIIYMAVSDDPEDYLKRVRSAYDMICEQQGSRNERYYLKAMQTAAAADSEEEIKEILDENRGQTDEDLSFDALIEDLDMGRDEAEREIKDAEGYLGMQKGFGVMGASQKLKDIYAAMLVCMAHGKGAEASGLAARLALDDALGSRFRA